MPTLSESMYQGAQDSTSQAGHSVGDAVNAFHIAATAEHAKQELDMEKEKQQINKATWVAQQYDKIGRVTGPAQGLMIDSFGKQMQQIQPGFDPSTLDVLKKDPDLVRTMAWTAGRELSKGSLTKEGSDALLSMHGDLDNYMTHATKLGEMKSQVEAAQMKASSFQGRIENAQDTAVQQAADKFDKDPNLLKLVPMGQTLGRDLKTLSDPKKVTYQTLHESLMNVANVLGGGSLSDARVGSITPKVSDEITAKINQFFSNDPMKAADPRYIKYVQDLVVRLHGAVKADVSDRADTIYSGRDSDLFHNPNLAEIGKRKLQHYKSGAWMGKTSAPAPTPPSHPVDQMSDDEVRAAYAKQKAGQ